MPGHRVSWEQSPPGSLGSRCLASLSLPRSTHTGDFQTILPVGEEGGGDSPGTTAKEPGALKGDQVAVTLADPPPSSIRAAPPSFIFYTVDLWNILTEKRGLKQPQILGTLERVVCTDRQN